MDWAEEWGVLLTREEAMMLVGDDGDGRGRGGFLAKLGDCLSGGGFYHGGSGHGVLSCAYTK